MAAAAFAFAAAAGATAAIAPFSDAAPGEALPPGWKRIELPGIKPARIELVADGAATVLRVRAEAAASSAAFALAADASAQPRLAWRWKVDRVVRGADMSRKEGDDYAARVYVTFDLPLEALPLAARTRIRVGRLFFGSDLPTAALCYVWDNRHPVDAAAWNAYSRQVRMVVLRSGEALAGRWVDEARDLESDYRAAFGDLTPGAVPRVSGVAVSADTDQTGETVTAWFGDLVLGPR